MNAWRWFRMRLFEWRLRWKLWRVWHPWPFFRRSRISFKGKATRVAPFSTTIPEGTFKWLPDKYVADVHESEFGDGAKLP